MIESTTKRILEIKRGLESSEAPKEQRKIDLKAELYEKRQKLSSIEH